jgi:hypothetical protein
MEGVLMTNSKITLTFLLLISITAGCDDHRVDRSDEEAMMVYRDCMGGPPPQVNSATAAATISNSGTVNKNTSIAANVQTQQEQNRETECMRMAGWETLGSE